jgi:hypothetical protein
MPDQLHQINISYVATEDRLMMRINTKQGDEFRLLLTRRFAGILLGLLNKEIDKQGGIPALASTNETRTMFKQGAMDKPYEAEKIVDYPLGQTGILTYKINYKSTAESSLALEILPENGKGVNMNLNKSMLFMFYNLLTQACGQTDWRLPDGDTVGAKVH